MENQYFIGVQKNSDGFIFRTRKHHPLKTLLFLFLPLVLIYSCEKRAASNKPYNQVLSITPSLAKSYHTDEVFESIEYLSLDNKERFIGSIDKVIFRNNQYFVIDKDNTNGLYVFDENGNTFVKLETRVMAQPTMVISTILQLWILTVHNKFGC